MDFFEIAGWFALHMFVALYHVLFACFFYLALPTPVHVFCFVMIHASCYFECKSLHRRMRISFLYPFVMFVTPVA